VENGEVESIDSRNTQSLLIISIHDDHFDVNSMPYLEPTMSFHCLD
jgi:hypothetical protein